MKRFIFFIALFAASIACRGMEKMDSLWNTGVGYYAQEDYQSALECFKQLETLGYESPELYYNIGNSYYKMSGYIAYSVLYYERALKLDPSYEDARANLEFVHQFTLDKIDKVPEFVLVTWFRNVRESLSSNAWAYISFACVVVMALLLLVFRFGRDMTLRKISFIFAIILAIFTAFSVAFSLGLKNEMSREDGAVVVTPVSSVKSSPNDASKSLFILHEGTKVLVLEELGQWNKVELSDGRQGWLMKRDIEII